MGRRLNRTVSSAPGERNVIGDHYVEEACTRLNKAAQQEAAMYVERIPMDTKLINSLFNADNLSVLRHAYGLVEPISTRNAYPLAPHAPGTLTLDFEGSGVVTPQERCFQPNDDAKPFFAACCTIKELHQRWGAVAYMLRWFNRNATLGAIRHYWPAAVTLCPNSPALKGLLEKPAERFNVPLGVTDLLPLIRETAATVASLQLLGDRPTNGNNGVSLTLPAGTVTLLGARVELKALTFHL